MRSDVMRLRPLKVTVLIGFFLLVALLTSPVFAQTAAVTEPLSPTAAQTLVSPDGRVTINVPAGAVATALDLQYTGQDLGQVPARTDFGLAGPQFLLDAQADGTPVESFRFQKSITIAISYTDADLATVLNRETALQIATYNSDLEAWVKLGGDLDPVNRTVTVLTRGVGYFSLAGDQTAIVPTPTPVTPVVGDFPPSSGLLLALALLGCLLVASGAYYLRPPSKEGRS